jgi:hypothetical protein
VVRDFLHLVFTKATTETHFSHMYATLCVRLSERLKEFVDAEGAVVMDSKNSAMVRAKQAIKFFDVL